ncbi:MAG: DUF342 domain-containing protein, partial [Desulfobacteraceae bacterium]|nr:DUF342 domain-containing protein [Desulfobacteraceae bacterium]
MENNTHIPSLANLAFQYGTITEDELKHIKSLFVLKQKENVKYSDLLLSQKFASQYQIELLKLIQEYMIIKKQGEVFGDIVVSKGLASKQDVEKAIELQKKDFNSAKTKKLIGDILVESSVLTLKQKQRILKEQDLLERYANTILAKDIPAETKNESGDPDILNELSEYEKQFLKIKVFDRGFSASVLEKGFASKKQINVAQRIQSEEFEKEHRISSLDNIMVNYEYLTEEEKNIVLLEQEKHHIDEQTQLDPDIQVIVSKNKMEAMVQIDKKNLSQVTLKDIKNALNQKRITYGIYSDALLQGNLDAGNDKFIAAKQDFSAELIKIRKATYHFDTSVIDKKKMKQGAALAQQRLAREKYSKQNILGAMVSQPAGFDSAFRCGEGVRLSKDKTKAFASRTGHPSLSIERKLFVHSTLNVLEDADLKYGPLEKYANINISGMLTGAYPVTTGHLKASEIRGASIESIGSIHVDIGITEASISCQGDIHARYIHGSRIEIFGDLYIENEIIDSQIFCSGKVDAPNCSVLSSQIHAKKGVSCARVGSDKTNACLISAGDENHILEVAAKINSNIKQLTKPLDDIIEKRDEKSNLSKKNFHKMVELKVFHDRAKKIKTRLEKEFEEKKSSIDKSR